MKYLTICFLFLIGCSSHEIIHPPKPEPIKTYESNMFMVDDNICMTSDEFLEFRLWLEDIKRYTVDVNDILCYYRDDC